MLQIGYFSTATACQDAAGVHAILLASREANRRNSVTGLLVAGGGRYLQVIEGPDAAVEALYRRILADDRHLAVARFLRRNISERTFGSWSMAYRRQSQLAEPNTFVSTLNVLTNEIADAELKQQIRFFAGAVMTDG